MLRYSLRIKRAGSARFLSSSGVNRPGRRTLYGAAAFTGGLAVILLHASTTTYLDSEQKRPRLKETDTSVYDARLSKLSSSSVPPPDSGIRRYDTAQLASNNPCEDEHSEAILPVPRGNWSFFTVLDGHSGGETSAWLRETLIAAIAGALGDLYSPIRSADPDTMPSSEAVDATLKSTFLALDDDIVNHPLPNVLSGDSKANAVHLLARAYAGSCALLAFYESETRLLRVALTGDSRAVLGRRTLDPATGRATYKYRALALSADQTGNNLAEEVRIHAEHPGEAVVKNGRVLGLGVARAFGDARFKWSVEVQERLKGSYLGRSLLPGIKTPPYLTAEPEITTTKIEPGDFLIMASDGLWESLTNEDAVGLVGWWLEGAKSDKDGGVRKPSELPVVVDHDYDFDAWSPRYGQWNAQKRFVNTDRNVATHLLRNALGGEDNDLTAALLSLGTARSRVYRDDITVTVVLFDDPPSR